MKTQGGFVKWIIVIIIALIVLGYYGIDVRKAAGSPMAKANIAYAKDIAGSTWNNYLKGSAEYGMKLVKDSAWPFIKAHCYPQLVCDVIGGK